MFMLPLQNALLFSIKTIFDLYISIVLFRLILQLVRADFYSPLAQAVVKLTNPLLVPLRKIIPGFIGVDWAAIVLALLLQATETISLLFIKGFTIAPTLASIGGLFIWSSGELADCVLNIFLFVTIIQVFLSWLTVMQPFNRNPNTAVFSQVTAPLFMRIRRFSPDLGVLDLSPMILIFFIVICRIIIAEPVISLGKSLI